jgi:hypothetical protein
LETGSYFFEADEGLIDTCSPDSFSFGDLTVIRTEVDCCHGTDSHATSGTISDNAYVYLSQHVNGKQDLFTFGNARHPVIFDSGASLGITFDRNDFDGSLTKPEGDLRLGGMAQGLQIEGIGSVTWTFRNPDGSEVQIRSNCYYVPGAKVRLLSPQRLFNSARGVGGKFEGNESEFKLIFDNGAKLTVEYDERNHLPIGYADVGVSPPFCQSSSQFVDS